MKPTPTVFDPRHKFQDEVWGRIILSDLERDVIDTPEFQRLFRTSQLGFVDLVYQTANHTRGAHSIGACHVASLLMDRLDKNCPALDPTDDGWVPVLISSAERVLIRLGALLHDISHVPLSHDLEKKTHKIRYDSGELKVRSHYGHYDKHDDYKSNPLLYLLIYNGEISVLAQVLRWYSRPFYPLLSGTGPDKTPPPQHLERFVNLLRTINDDDWRPEDDLLPDLLFHLLIHEDPKEAAADYAAIQNITKRYDADCLEEWGLGPKAYRRELHDLWYQPFRHDIIGNTLSADLIDYLRRDSQRLGMDRRIDLHLLNYYVLKRYKSTHATNHSVADALDAGPKRFRCAIDLHDHKRNTSRIELVNDIFRLLDLRHEIHEKAVLHRVVQAANAMLARALLLLGDEKKPKARELVRLDEPVHALQGEESFFQLLVDRSNPKKEENKADGPQLRDANRLIHKLIERRVCRPLLIIPGYQAADYLKEPDTELTHKDVERILRTIAMIIDSRYYSRFLLFVSACIEKYLQGMFHSREDLCRHVEWIINDDKAVDDAMKLVPSRVIVWTTPYK